MHEPRPYATAAAHHLVGRPPYSAELVELLRAEMGLDGSGVLIDVGCGPGVLAVELSRLFDTVIGIDPEPAMLEAERHAADRGVSASWIEARAEDLADLALPAARLVTFGQSLHWTDRHRALTAVYDLLEPGGAVAPIAPDRLGHDLDAFIADLRTVLDSTSPSGRFFDWPGDTAVIWAAKHR